MDNDLQFSPEQKSLFGEPSAPPRVSKTGVWGDDTVKSAKSRKSALSGLFEQERFQSPRLRRLDSDDDIPIIPDVEDMHDEEHLSDIADAPRVPTNIIPSLTDLNADLKKQSAFKTFEGVNVSILSKSLYKESEIKEDDSPWSWDLLFTEVTSELRSEWEKNNSTKL